MKCSLKTVFTQPTTTTCTRSITALTLIFQLHNCFVAISHFIVHISNLPQEKEFLLKLIPSSERKSKLGKYASVRWRHMDDEERQLYQDLEKFA